MEDKEHGRRGFLSYAAYGIGGGALLLTGQAGMAKGRDTKARGIYDVKDFGAKADGHTIDTAAINKAIAEASSAGGGTVRFPGG
ncbi:MAG: glycosyl hydrolase family 28-related protein, partial [Bryobacteraceae bacterium]